MAVESKKNKAKKNTQRHRLLVLICLCVVYLALALSYSLLTPAWEANDEVDHTMYAEYIVAHGSLPHISLNNGHESHQPPLYYLALAVWQKALGIPSFQPDPIPVPGQPALGPSTQPRLGLSHHYTAKLKQQAIWLHELRLLSVVFGLGTVTFTFLIANTLTKKLTFSVAATLFVVLLPKQLVISSVVTNDSLVIMLSSLVLYIAVKLCNAQDQKIRLYSFLLGVVGGAATLTKLNSLPLIVLFFVLLVAHLYKKKKYTLSGSLLSLIGFAVICGWWLIYNQERYGDPLAQKVSNDYLIPAIPGLIRPVSWFNSQRFLHFLPSELHQTAWYDAGWNQLILPDWMNSVLWALAFVSLFGAAVYVWKNFRRWNYAWEWGVLFVIIAIFAGLLTTYIIARTTYQAEGRVAYIGLSAFAILSTGGLTVIFTKLLSRFKNASLFIWPAVFALVNIYIFVHILIPLHAL